MTPAEQAVLAAGVVLGELLDAQAVAQAAGQASSNARPLEGAPPRRAIIEAQHNLRRAVREWRGS